MNKKRLHLAVALAFLLSLVYGNYRAWEAMCLWEAGTSYELTWTPTHVGGYTCAAYDYSRFYQTTVTHP